MAIAKILGFNNHLFDFSEETEEKKKRLEKEEQEQREKELAKEYDEQKIQEQILLEEEAKEKQEKQEQEQEETKKEEIKQESIDKDFIEQKEFDNEQNAHEKEIIKEFNELREKTNTELEVKMLASEKDPADKDKCEALEEVKEDIKAMDECKTPKEMEQYLDKYYEENKRQEEDYLKDPKYN